MWNFADIGSINHNDLIEIDKLKEIYTRDGKLLFINVSKNVENNYLFCHSVQISKHCSKLPTVEDLLRRLLSLVEDFPI